MLLPLLQNNLMGEAAAFQSAPARRIIDVRLASRTITLCVLCALAVMLTGSAS